MILGTLRWGDRLNLHSITRSFLPFWGGKPSEKAGLVGFGAFIGEFQVQDLSPAQHAAYPDMVMSPQ